VLEVRSIFRGKPYIIARIFEDLESLAKNLTSGRIERDCHIQSAPPPTPTPGIKPLREINLGMA